MNVLILNHNVIEFGTYFRALALAREFSKRKHNVDFITVSSTNRLGIKRYKKDGITFHLMPAMPVLMGKDEGWGLWEILRRICFSINKRYALIYSFDHKPNVVLPALYLKKRNGAILIADWCDWWGDGGLLTKNAKLRKKMIKGKPHRWIRHHLQSLLESWETKWEQALPLHYADFVTLICRPLRDRALKLGLSEEKAYLLPSGCNINIIKQENKRQAREKLGLSSQSVYLGFLGNYHPDIPFLLDAVSDVLLKNKHLQLLLITPNSVFLQHLLETSPVKDRVIVTDKVPFNKLSPYLGACDLLLLPQDDYPGNYGRLPNKFCDYLAAGRPIVATDVGDVGFYIKKYELGKASKPNRADFADCISEMLNSTEDWEELGNKGRMLAEGEFNWEIISSKLYKRLKEDCLVSV